MQLFSSNAKTLIMLRIANGTVDITTIESLCLLSYASFIGKYLSVERRRDMIEIGN